MIFVCIGMAIAIMTFSLLMFLMFWSTGSLCERERLGYSCRGEGCLGCDD